MVFLNGDVTKMTNVISLDSIIVKVTASPTDQDLKLKKCANVSIQWNKIMSSREEKVIKRQFSARPIDEQQDLLQQNLV